MTANEIAHWDAQARKGFTYKIDGKVDIWRSHANDVLEERQWEDDCDGLAETVLDLCFRSGLLLNNGYRLVVAASSDGSGHMIGCATDDDNRMWIIGDTFKEHPYHAENMLHKPNIYNRLSETEWRGGVPWRLV